jgi:hypothetical protein
MPNRYPRDIEQRMRRAVAAWQTIDPAMQVGKLSVADLEAAVARGEQIKSEMGALEAQMTELRDERSALHLSGWDLVKRLRRWVQSVYGEDSSEYALTGGTRLSERKPYRPRKRAVAPVAPGADQAESG